MNARHDTVAGADELLDVGVVLCLEEAEAGRDAVIRWLAQHPHLAGELAEFLAGQAQVADWAAPLHEISAPTELPAVDGEGVGEPVRIGGYEVIDRRDAGGMGVVYQARQEVTGKVVALKVIRPDRLHGLSAEERRTWVERFRLEIRCVAEGKHNNIVPIYHVGEHEGLPFYSMEWAQGGTLADQMAQLRSHPVKAARLLAQVARAVHHVHDLGILHRDLKPGNLLLDGEGQPLVADFGLAKRLDGGSHTQSEAIVGTPWYMAPEQASKDQPLTKAADVFSLGAILYECLTGQPPYGRGDVVETLGKMAQPIPPPRSLDPGVDRNLENLCLRCLERDPADRYPSAEALAEDLERYGHGGTIARSAGSLLTRVKEALRHREPAGRVATWADSWWYAVLLLVTHTLVFGIVHTGQSAFWVWVVYLTFYACSVVKIVNRQIRDYSELSMPERRGQVVIAGGVFAQIVLLLVFGLGAQGDSQEWILAWYPSLSLTTGMTLFALGVTHWGRWYLGGLVLILLALPLSWYPEWAPLLFGVTVAAALGWFGLATRRFARAFQEAFARPAPLPETTGV